MMVMRTAPRIMIFKGTRDSLNDGHENCPEDDHLETRWMMDLYRTCLLALLNDDNVKKLKSLGLTE